MRMEGAWLSSPIISLVLTSALNMPIKNKLAATTIQLVPQNSIIMEWEKLDSDNCEDYSRSTFFICIEVR